MKGFLILASVLILFSSCQHKNAEDETYPSKAQVDEAFSIIGENLTGEITVSCFDEEAHSKFLREAAAIFEQNNPGTKINIETFSSPAERTYTETEDGNLIIRKISSDEGKADYISRVTTELMGGKGADIYAMDVLPYYKFAEGSVLTDLNAFIEADSNFNLSDYKSNIFTGLSYLGGQYMLPADFYFRLIAFNGEKVGEREAAKLRENGAFTYWEMTDLVKEAFLADKDGSKIMEISFTDDITELLFGYVLALEEDKFVDRTAKTANFTDGKFEDFLTKFKTQADNNYFKPALTEGEGNIITNFDNPVKNTGYYFRSLVSVQLKDFFLGEALETKPNFPVAGENDKLLGLMTNDLGQAAYSYRKAYAINTYSNNKKLAWELLKFLVSEEMQTSINLVGLPVNSKAFEKVSKLFITENPNYSQADEEGNFTITGYYNLGSQELRQKLHRDYLNFLRDAEDKLSIGITGDTEITEMIKTESFEFFGGLKTARSAAEALQSSVSMYLSE
ncbi:MAG: extracellular solute-binding protein [Clostridiales bacterium]|nr:extracellular solute-binding protein [Clostridiales bacterium]